MKIYVLSEKEFRILFLKKFSELQDNTDTQLHKIRKMHEQNELNNSKISEARAEDKMTE